jgi:hypothetical protein
MGNVLPFKETIERKKEKEIDKKSQDLHDLIYDLYGICNRLDEIDVKDLPKTFKLEIARSITEIKKRLRKTQLRLF